MNNSITTLVALIYDHEKKTAVPLSSIQSDITGAYRYLHLIYKNLCQ